LRLSTIVEIAREEKVPLPSYEPEELRRYVQMTEEDRPDFQLFLGKFQFLRRLYSTREVIQRVTYEAVSDAARDNVVYLELRFNPLALAESQGFPPDKVTDWVLETARKAARDCGITIGLIVTITRDCDRATARRLVQLALERRGKGIVGIDLAGDEMHYSAWPFAKLFQDARRRGLGITVHAGEVTGPEKVREAVELLGAHRIGHGVKASEDPDVLDLLRLKSVALEICLTSNMQTGAVQDIARHPLRSFYRLGIPVTLNTDDPGVSNTTLTEEYLLALQKVGLSMKDLQAILFNGVQAAFLPPGEKSRLDRECRGKLRALGM